MVKQEKMYQVNVDVTIKGTRVITVNAPNKEEANRLAIDLVDSEAWDVSSLALGLGTVKVFTEVKGKKE